MYLIHTHEKLTLETFKMQKMNIELEDEEEGSGHVYTKCLKMKKKKVDMHAQNV